MRTSLLLGVYILAEDDSIGVLILTGYYGFQIQLLCKFYFG